MSELKVQKVSTYDFFLLLDTRLDLMNLSLGLIVGDLVDLMFPDDTQRLLGIQLPLAYMPGNTRSRHDMIVMLYQSHECCLRQSTRCEDLCTPAVKR
jgi:hypothetical protein